MAEPAKHSGGGAITEHRFGERARAPERFLLRAQLIPLGVAREAPSYGRS